MDTPYSFSSSGIVSHFLTFSPFLIALIYLFSAAGKRKSVEGANQNNNEVVDKSSCCASCGKAEIDDIKLKECDGCDLVRYCSDECRENHKSQHDEACKERTAELLRDELLFKQPESSHLGDCPICCLPMPIGAQKTNLMSCCSKVICRGCDYANQNREIEMRRQQTCPFCREPMPNTKEEAYIQSMKRVEANDPVAIRQEGIEQYNKGYHGAAFDYYRKAAVLGDAEAHYNVSLMYQKGKGVEKERISSPGRGCYWWSSTC